MQQSRTALSAGQPVIVRDERWTILHAQRFDGTSLVRLRGASRENCDEIQSVLTAADLIQPVPSESGLRHRSRRAVLTIARSALAGVAAWDDCWTMHCARIERRDWQWDPARAAVMGAMRILLADEVGLGKTIQAALVISELRARGLAERVLVLTPASIRQQWADELHDRFNLSPAVFDHSTLAIAAATLPVNVNPWKTAQLIISSIDLVKRPEVRAALEAVPFDMLVVDEAHHLKPGTDRASVVAELADRVPWIVLATATPHDGDDEAFQLLQNLGDVGSEGLRVFRRRRLIGRGGRLRSSRLLFVRPTSAEQALLEATCAYARALTFRHRDRSNRLVASVVSRRAASSAEAVRRTLTRRIALLARDIEPERQALLPWEEDESDEVTDTVLAIPGLRDVAQEVTWLTELAALAQSAAQEQSSKVLVIRRLLRRTAEQVLVFSEYRDVVLEVATAVADLCETATLHGGLTARERRDVVRGFTSGHIRVLVATDAAGEGLNLQARCRLVVNVELPWTPRRLEQRIGRVDRLGQRRRVHAIHLAHSGSYEGTVIARLERRRERAQSMNLGSQFVHGNSLEHLERSVAPFVCRTEGAKNRAAVYTSRSRLRTSRVLLLFEVTFADGGGRPIARQIVACRIECGRSTDSRLSRSVIRRLCRHELVQRALHQHIVEFPATALPATAVAGAAMARRLSALASHLERLEDCSPWQASLFDRRAEQRVHARQQSVADLQHHLRQRRESVASLSEVVALPHRLVAAWRE